MKKLPLLFVLLLSISQAHNIEHVYMEMDPSKESFDALISVDAAYCLPEFRGDSEKGAPDHKWLESLTEKEHARLRVEAQRYVRAALTVIQDDTPLDLTITFPDYETTPYTFHASSLQAPQLRIRLTGTYLPKGGSLKANWRDLFRANLLLKTQWTENGVEKESLITVMPGSTSELGIHITPDKGDNDLSAPSPEVKSHTASWWSFIKIGFSHIIPHGADHIAFIIGLFLCNPKWRPLIHQSLIFTLAHSLTLALTLLEVVSFPSKWVEIIIALSIVYIAIENLFGKKVNARRLLLVFFFGLLHGLGFGSVLNEYITKKELLTPLLSFNIGVEAGQLFILTLCYFTIGKCSKSFSKVRSLGSIIIAIIGAYWVIERL